jgi:dienelactone hydrolase
VARLRVQFIHGLEGSPQGSKARTLAAAFDACTPAMDTQHFEACVALQAETIHRFRPDVLVGSSFGGAVAVALLQREHWCGPTLLLAQAALRQGLRRQLPRDVPIWLVHATGDQVVPVRDSRRLARSGTPGLVRLFEVEDDHALHDFVASGRLVSMARELAAVDAEAAASTPQPGRLARFVAPFFEEPTLWPVLAVLAAHGVLLGSIVLALSARDHNPFAIGALALLSVASVDALTRRIRARSFGRLGWSVVLLWLTSALGALLAVRFDFF